MNNFHGGPGGPFPGPGFGPGFGPAPGPGFGPAPGPGFGPAPGPGFGPARPVIFFPGVTSSTNRDLGRLEDDILTTDKLPWYKFKSRLSARYERFHVKMDIEASLRRTRRAQIRKMILEDMSNNVGGRSTISTKDIFNTLNKNKGNVKVKRIFFPLIREVCSSIYDAFEQSYVSFYKKKASLKFKNDKKRDNELKKIDNFINFIGNDWLNGTLLHNYNIYSIKIGTISKKNNYDGLLPDMADLAAIAKQNNPNAATPVQNAQNTNSQRTNTQNTHNNTKTQSNANTQSNVNTQNNTNTQSNVNTQNNTNTQSNINAQNNTNTQSNINAQNNTNTQNNAKTQVNTTPQPAKIQSQPSPVKISDINDYPPVYVDPWIEGMFSNDWEKTDESVSMDVEILDDKTHHHK